MDEHNLGPTNPQTVLDSSTTPIQAPPADDQPPIIIDDDSWFNQRGQERGGVEGLRAFVCWIGFAALTLDIIAIVTLHERPPVMRFVVAMVSMIAIMTALASFANRLRWRKLQVLLPWLPSIALYASLITFSLTCAILDYIYR